VGKGASPQFVIAERFDVLLSPADEFYIVLLLEQNMEAK